MSSSAKDLIKKMLMVDPDARISAIDALRHPWITNENKKASTLHAVQGRFSMRRSIK